ncbi:uncharacterized protein LOC125664430 [Ostrea edulis]|uniref:uncharacterized protein LOC125664430 n=1 Tax=Ostrea edulis TaxID=37623 RepID=UPI0020958198|nr:uncharacterized protein LOC125664430 [Ostrea edulis]
MRSCLLNILLVSNLACQSWAIYCYQCGDGKSNGSCQEDIAGMAKDHEMHKQNDTTSKVEDFVYRKKCADSEKACMIERIEINGVVVAYIRDCSDGINFSINASRFQTISPDRNVTTCTYVEAKFFTCLSLCDKDLCNGPQSDSNTSSTQKAAALWLTIVITAILPRLL